MPDVKPASFQDLASIVAGRLVTRGEPDYPEAAAHWALATPTTPAAVLDVAGVADIVAAVRFAAANDIAVSVQPLGHGASPVLNDTLLIRTTALNSMEIDTQRGIAKVGAGVMVGDFQNALDGTGFTGLPGNNPAINLVAFCLGGGYSLLGPVFGNAAAGIRAADVVTADGQELHIDDESHPDLMWALRGGGGGMAIVTSLEIDLQSTELAGGRLMFTAADAPLLVEPFLDFLARKGPRTCAIWHRTIMPDQPQVPEHIRGTRVLFIDLVHAGPLAQLEALVQPLIEAAEPVRSTISARQPGGLCAICEEPTIPLTAVGRAVLVDELNGELLAALDKLLDDNPALHTVQLRTLGGGFDTEQSRAGAYSSRRGSGLVIGASRIPNEEVRAFVNSNLDRIIPDLAPYSAAGGVPLTFIDWSEPIERAFDEPTLARLRQVKRSVDPAGVLTSNRPIG